jgi:isopentenyldiphosphate isomerase
MTEQSCLKLVFATLWQVIQCWHGVRMSEFEQQQLKRLRNELGLASQDASDDSLQQVA